ncbi:MAG: hypothetical protein AAF563_11790 [Pseudomonadota bacterium]
MHPAAKRIARFGMALMAAACAAGLPAPIWASQAYMSAGSKEGQAILFERGGACFALAPTHLIEGSDGFATLVGDGGELTTGRAWQIRDLGFDLSLFGVRGSIESACGGDLPNDAELSSVLAQGSGEVQLRYLFEDGSVARRAAQITDTDGSFIYLSETGDWVISQGHSGSAIVQGDTTIGIMMQLGAEGEAPRALRFDKAVYLVRWEWEGSGEAPQAPSPPAVGVDGIVVERTSALPLGPDDTVEHLVAPLDEAGHWRAKAISWPVDLVLQMPGNEVANVAGLVFHTLHGEAVAHPRTIEVLRTVSAEGERSWSPVTSLTLQPVGGIREITFEPAIRTRRLKIVIYDTWLDDGETVELNRIEVLIAP